MADHYAINDQHAIAIGRNIVASLNREVRCNNKINSTPDPPLFNADQLYGIVGTNLKKSFDIKQVRIHFMYNLNKIIDIRYLFWLFDTGTILPQFFHIHICIYTYNFTQRILFN